MKRIIASDIHGSALYCGRLIEHIRAERADGLILLGDILYHGPRNALPDGYDPKAVADMLNALECRVVCVRGNCDSEVDQMLLKFPIMATYALMDIGESVVYMTHGHVNGREDPPRLRRGDVLLCGHTHIPADEMLPCGIKYVNPGSVAIPKGGSERGYILLENGEFVHKAL